MESSTTARVNVLMPQMGFSVTEGTVTRWLKQVGERVEADEPFFEISTDKVDAEIPSPTTGLVVEIVCAEGVTVAVDSVVAVIDRELLGRPKPPTPNSTHQATATPLSEPLVEHFSTLGIPLNATADEIKTAYRDLAMAWHPDRFTDGDVERRRRAGERLQRVNEAYAYIQRHGQQCAGDETVTSVPIQEDMQSAQLAMLQIVVKAQSLCIRLKTAGVGNTDAAHDEIDQMLTAAEEMIRRLEGLIIRFETEIPSMPIEGLKASVTNLRGIKEEMIQAALEVGISL